MDPQFRSHFFFRSHCILLLDEHFCLTIVQKELYLVYDIYENGICFAAHI